MKQVIKCGYCMTTLMEVEKKDYENARLQFILNVDIIKKCEGCTKKRKQYTERQFSITDILKSTENTIVV